MSPVTPLYCKNNQIKAHHLLLQGKCNKARIYFSIKINFCLFILFHHSVSNRIKKKKIFVSVLLLLGGDGHVYFISVLSSKRVTIDQTLPFKGRLTH